MRRHDILYWGRPYNFSVYFKSYSIWAATFDFKSAILEHHANIPELKKSQLYLTFTWLDLFHDLASLDIEDQVHLK